MKQYLHVGIVILLLLAVFGVLLTPDTSDDPTGMVRLNKGRLIVAPVLEAQLLSLPYLVPASPIMFSRMHFSTSVAKLDLLCSRLC